MNAGAWALSAARYAFRGAWFAVASVAWLVALGVTSAFPGRLGSVAFWFVAVVGAAAALGAVWLPMLRRVAPVWADVLRATVVGVIAGCGAGTATAWRVILGSSRSCRKRSRQ